jgi:hypothetical protein
MNVEPEIFEIKIKGILCQKWSYWFDGSTLMPEGKDVTILTGTVRDQGDLHGLLAKIHDLGLPLLSVVKPEAESEN